MKIALIASAVAFAGGCLVGSHWIRSDPAALYAAQGREEWPYYANYRSSYSDDDGIPINRTVSSELGNPSMSLGVSQPSAMELGSGPEFKKQVRDFAIAVLKYPNVPVYAVSSDMDGEIMLCLGDYGNLAADVTVATVKPTHRTAAAWSGG